MVLMDRKDVTLPGPGEIMFDSDGKVICHICGKSFNKVLAHVWQKHGLSAKEYKIKFGLNTTKGIVSESTREKCQKAVRDNFDKVVVNNLINKGTATRFTVGSEGRTKDNLSLQSYKALVKRAKDTNFINLRRKQKNSQKNLY